MALDAIKSVLPEALTGSTNRDRTRSPSDAPSPRENLSASASPGAQTADVDDEIIEADDNDSALGDNGSSSNGTSIRSEFVRGYVENGRRYATLRGKDGVFAPSDDKQFEVYETLHLVTLMLDSQRRNPLFQSPISEKAQDVLDIGTGDGSWAIDTADKFPNLTVRGVDLYPPPRDWVAPNCILEVENVLETWTWNKKFDLIHIRMLMGSFTTEEWQKVYLQAYDNLQPGGWIEQIETDIQIRCDDGTMPADSHLAKFHEIVNGCAAKISKPMDVHDQFKGSIEKAGFVNLHKIDYKAPYGEWPKLQVYKHIGRVMTKSMKAGLEGWLIWFLTNYGDPKPWSPEEVQVYLAFLRKELDSGWHMYQRVRRVWAQKPYDTPKTEQKVDVENV